MPTVFLQKHIWMDIDELFTTPSSNQIAYCTAKQVIDKMVLLLSNHGDSVVSWALHICLQLTIIFGQNCTLYLKECVLVCVPVVQRIIELAKLLLCTCFCLCFFWHLTIGTDCHSCIDTPCTWWNRVHCILHALSFIISSLHQKLQLCDSGLLLVILYNTCSVKSPHSVCSTFVSNSF